jgi:uncharacterized membrane protein
MSYNDWTLPYKKLIHAFPNLPSSFLHKLPYGIGILAFLGFLDATYLTVLHYKNIIPPCSVARGCETVLTSQFATIFGIPIALLGAGFYLAVLALLLIWIQTKRTNLLTLLVTLTGIGLLVGILLVVIQAFVLHAFCQYCLTSELIDFLLFDCAWWLWRKSE